MTSLADLKGLMVAAKPFKKEITFKHGDEQLTATIYVKQLGIGQYESVFLERDDAKSRTARVISSAVTVGENGKDVIPYSMATELLPAMAAAMLEAFHEVNNPKKS